MSIESAASPFNLSRYCLEENSKENGNKTALVFVSENGRSLEEITYEELQKNVLSFSSWLQGLGLKKSGRVFIKLKTSPHFVTAFFGAIAAGLVPVPLSHFLTINEVQKYAEIAEPELIIAEADDGLMASENLTDVRMMSSGEVNDILSKNMPSQYVETLPDDPAFLVFTSGTSAEPKAVLHAQRVVLGRKPMFEGWSDIGPSDRVLHAGALNWTYSLGVGLFDVFCASATALFYRDTPSPEDWPDVINRSRPTIFSAVPSFYRRLLKYGDMEKIRSSDLRHGLTAGEPLSEKLFSSWKEATDLMLFEALGMSEISTYISSSPQIPPKPGSPGKPQMGRKIAILCQKAVEESSKAQEMPVGEVGLIAVHQSDPGLLLGYLVKGELSAPEVLEEWFLTGDLARLDQDGYIWFEGRRDEIMNASGYRVSPVEIETLLSRAKSVVEIAVCECGIAADLRIITAFVVLASGCDEGEAIAEIKSLSLEIAGYKRPREFRFVPSLPRTANGKLKRSEIIASFEAKRR